MTDGTLTLPAVTVTLGNVSKSSRTGSRASRRHRSRPDVEARRQRREERREELVDAAVEAIRNHGPDASMEQIAREAGITKPILYRHVGGRDEFVTALTERFVGDLIERLEVALAQDRDDLRGLLATGFDTYLELIERETELYRFLIRRVGGQQGAGEVLNSVIRRIASIDTQIIGEQLREAGADSGAAEPWGYGLVGMVHAAGDWWLDNRTMPRERLVEYLVSLAWDGMGRAAVGQARS